MGLSEDFFALSEDAMEEVYQSGALTRDMMFAHDVSNLIKTCHGDLCILKGMLEGFNSEAIPTDNDAILFKNVLCTVMMQVSLISSLTKQISEKYPDILNQDGGEK